MYCITIPLLLAAFGMEMTISLGCFSIDIPRVENHAHTEASPGHVPGSQQEDPACGKGQGIPTSRREGWKEVERVVWRQRQNQHERTCVPIPCPSLHLLRPEVMFQSSASPQCPAMRVSYDSLAHYR